MNEEKEKPLEPGRRFDGDREEDKNIRKLISDIEEKLENSIKPETIVGLNSFERKLVHRHFDHNQDFETRTYRDGENFKFLVYPVGNIANFAKEKAQESLDGAKEVELPHMGSYERYIVHTTLKDISGVDSSSFGEGSERHVKIVCKKFGRGLKRIVKKIKLF